tara:strand:- start:230 stop:391 length:162 start_codon:yes stop_codon:yes gene_type:complete
MSKICSDCKDELTAENRNRAYGRTQMRCKPCNVKYQQKIHAKKKKALENAKWF